jgi:hypothetical protein
MLQGIHRTLTNQLSVFLLIYLFGLFNNSVSSLDYIESSGRMFSE